MEGLLALDREWFLAINHGLAARWLDLLFYAITYLGNGVAIAVLALPLVFVWDRPRLWRVVALAVIALAAGGLLVLAIKWGVGRPRPPVDPELLGTGVRALIDLGSNSFPSGHAQTAAGAAMIFGLIYRRLWLTLPLILVAALVGLSRIYLGVHFPLDVIVGFALGALVALGAWLALGARFGLRERREPG